LLRIVPEPGVKEVLRLLLGWWSVCIGGRCAGFGRWREDKPSADEGKALQGEFGLEKLVLRAGEEVGGGSGDGGDQMVDRDWLAVEGSLLIGVGSQLDGLDRGDLRTGLLGEDGPETGIVAGDGQGKQGFKSAGVEIREEDSAGMRVQPDGGTAAVGGDVQQNQCEPLTVALN
jgi:hypothetical protein